MSNIEKDVLFFSLLGGACLLICLTGSAWAVRGLFGLVREGKDIA